MTYSPINIPVYVASYSGAIAGMGVSGWIIDPAQSNYDNVTKIAGAFAEAFDIAWDSSTPLNNLEVASITSIVSTEFAERGPGPLDNPRFQTTANWDIAVRACIALVLESDAYFAAQGINPGTGGGGGAVTTDGVTNVSTLSGTTLTDALNNIQDFNVFNTSSVSGSTVSDALNTLNGLVGVRTFATRQGNVVPANGDYNGNQITNNSSVAGSTVEAALNTISIAGFGVRSVFGRTNIITAATGDYKASQINNDASVAGTHVSDALENLQTQVSIAANVQPFFGTYYVNPAFGGSSTGSQSNPFTTIAAAFAFAASLSITSGIIYLRPGIPVVENVSFPLTGAWEIACESMITPGATTAGITGNIDVSTSATARRALTRIKVTGTVTGNAVGGASRLFLTNTQITGALTLTLTAAAAWRVFAVGIAPANAPTGYSDNTCLLQGAVSVAGSFSGTNVVISVSLAFSQNSELTDSELPTTVTANAAVTLWLKGISNVGGTVTFVAASGTFTVNPDGSALSEMQRFGILTSGTVNIAAQRGGRGFRGNQAANVGVTQIIAQQQYAGMMQCSAVLTLLANGGTATGNAVLNVTYTDLNGTVVTEAVTAALNVAGALGSKGRGVLPFSQNGATAIQWSVTGITVATGLSYAVDVAVHQLT